MILQCKKCKQDKDISLYYKHNEGYMGVTQPCKECKKEYGRSENYREGARIRDYERYHNNNHRRLYSIWCGMKSRCENINNTHYKWYGKKGISVVWKTFKQFEIDMLQSYIKHTGIYGKSRKYTQIDRVDNNGNYCKENCRRTTCKENNEFNKKRTLVTNLSLCKILNH